MNGGAAPQTPLPNRCVIWHPRGVRVGAALLNDLARFGVQVTATTTSEFAALAQVALDAREIEAKRATGSMLVIVEPGRLPMAGEVLRVTRAHGMRTVVWCCDADAAASLRRFEEPKPPLDDAQPKPRAGDIPPATNPVVVPNPAAAAKISIGPPKLRLAGDDRPPEQADGNRRTGSILSDAELAMLLSDEP